MPEAMMILDDNIAKLKAHPMTEVALETICNIRGASIYNQLLEVARTQSARNYIVVQRFESACLIIRPQGETTRWDSRLDDQGWSLNRRAHFLILP
jgi:outer membrane protein OmpA-like peptidoglycan-associated protein